MQAYLDLLDDILRSGMPKEDRTGVGTLSVFGRHLRFDLALGFPLLTTKRLHVPSIIYELLWFLSGETNVRFLRDHGVSIWDEWADADGELGPVYGKQWRSWELPNGEKLDQLARVIESIKHQPDSRRHLVLAWNPADVDRMALPPCHYAYQFYVARGKLSCLFHMRSIDVFLGLPFNIASYALLTHMVADQCGLGVGELIWTGGDVHLYRNHLTQAREQMKRKPYPPPQLHILRTPEDLFSYRREDFRIDNYQAHPHIKAPIAV